MGFTPIKAFVKGGAEFAQKVALARLEGEYELKKAIGLQKAKSQAENAGKLINFQAGNVKLTFTNSDLKDTDARNTANITDMNNVLGKDNYKRFINAAKNIRGGDQKVQDLNNFLIGRTSLWADGTAVEEKVGDAVKVVKYKDIIGSYNQYLDDGYGEAFIKNVIAPAYNVNYERFQKKYGNKLGFMSNKKLTSDRFVSYEHIPYLTKQVYDSGDGQFIIQQANDIAKKLNRPYQELLGAWQTGATDQERLDVNKQKVIWEIYAELKRKLPKNGLDLDNLGTYTRSISAARKKAFNNGVTPTVFANMLQAFVPSFNATDVKPFIYVTTSARDQAISKQHADHLRSEYKIDSEQAAQKAQAAQGAAGLATRMYQEFEQSRFVSPGVLQPTVAGAQKVINGFFGPTGMLTGFSNLFAKWRTNERGFNTVGRSRLEQRLLASQNSIMGRFDTTTRRKARIEYMKFNLAYQMASAFQGGTGGRTISDQDIENMMNAMNFEYDSSEDQIIEALRTIASVMEDVAVIQEGYGKGGKAAAVSYVLEKTNEGFGVDFSRGGNFADYAVAKLKGKVASPDEFNITYTTKSVDNPDYDASKPDEMRRRGIPKKIFKSVRTVN